MKINRAVVFTQHNSWSEIESKLNSFLYLFFDKIQDPRVAEQLVSFFHQDSVRGEAHNVSGAESIRVNELELEVERLASRSEHLRAQNDVLALTLAESRALGERLAVVLGEYSSSLTFLFFLFFFCLLLIS